MTRIALAFLALCTITFWGCGDVGTSDSSRSVESNNADIQQNPDEEVVVSPGAGVVAAPVAVPAPIPVPAPVLLPPPPPLPLVSGLVGFNSRFNDGGHHHQDDHDDDDEDHERRHCDDSHAPEHCPDVPKPCVCPTPSGTFISLEKTANVDELPPVGEEIEYTFIITNGPVPLTNVSITEIFFSGVGEISAIECDQDLSLGLAANDVVECSATYIVQQGDEGEDLANAARVSGDDPDGRTVSDSAAFNIEAPSGTSGIAAIRLQKVAVPPIVTTGPTIAYTLTATNTGTLPITNVSILDTLFTGTPPLTLACDLPAPVTLLPGESLECTATYTVIPADVTAGFIFNRAEVTGNVDGALISDKDVFMVLIPAPTISLEKTVTFGPGVLLTYIFTATNTGGQTLTNVVIEDTFFTGTGIIPPSLVLTCPMGPITLAPDAQLVCTAQYVPTEADFTAGVLNNTAVATGSFLGIEVSDDDELEVPLVFCGGTAGACAGICTAADTLCQDGVSGGCACLPSLVLTKTVASVGANGLVTYNFHVENVGAVPLTAVTVEEIDFTVNGELRSLPNIECTPPVPTDLALGASFDCTAQYQLVDADFVNGIASLVNVARATGTSESMQVSVTDDTTDAFNLCGSIIDDSGCSEICLDPSTACAEDLAGNCTCLPTPLCGTGVGCEGSCPDDFGCEGTAGDCVCSPAELTVEKTSEVDENGVITYNIVATNSGPVTVKNVTITDPLLDFLDCPPQDLMPGWSFQCEGKYTVTQGDLNAGNVSNTATATGSTASGTEVTASDTEDTALTACSLTAPQTCGGICLGAPVCGSNGAGACVCGTPALSLTKVVSEVTPLGLVSYFFQFQNLGDVPLTQVTVNETVFNGTPANLTNVSCFPPFTVGAGMLGGCVYEYQLVAQDFAGGVATLINEANVTGSFAPHIVQSPDASTGETPFYLCGSEPGGICSASSICLGGGTCTAADDECECQ